MDWELCLVMILLKNTESKLNVLHWDHKLSTDGSVETKNLIIQSAVERRIYKST